MLAQYKIYDRRKRPPSDPLPAGVRQDTRWRRTKHPLHPSEEVVKEYLAAPSETAWRKYRTVYLEELERRFRKDRGPFDKLVDLAMEGDVFTGCSCPTNANLRVDRCHTFLALELMQDMFPALQVEFPPVRE